MTEIVRCGEEDIEHTQLPEEPLGDDYENIRFMRIYLRDKPRIMDYRIDGSNAAKPIRRSTATDVGGSALFNCT